MRTSVHFAPRKSAFKDNATEIGEMFAHTPGLKRGNPWGLYDMHGNVHEWCRDLYHIKLPGGTDPEGAGGSLRAMRGGAWHDKSLYCRSASRGGLPPQSQGGNLGFRIARVPVANQ